MIHELNDQELCNCKDVEQKDRLIKNLLLSCRMSNRKLQKERFEKRLLLAFILFIAVIKLMVELNV